MRETTGFRAARIAVLLFLAAYTLVPLYVMVVSSLKPLKDVQGTFTWWPSRVTLSPFADIWTTIPLATYLKNSLIVSVTATVISVTFSTLAGYAVSRYVFRGRKVFTTTILGTQMFPGILFLLPLYLIFVSIGQNLGFPLVGSRTGLIITYLTFALPFSVWMLAGYLDGIPRELDEAAQVDGSSVLGTLWRVILPVARPGIIAVAVFTFIVAWGEILFASVLTNAESRTLSVGLQQYATQGGVYWNQVMAASLVISIPVVAGFLFLQRFFIAGLTSGSVK